ncbi:hypothetical protein, partial [Staphylococcus shinii]|uniref:hypothetical protein n=1 Tax=Staphylococcus shinii TaxID=2912228 RepID=UPI001C40277B
SFYFWFSLYFLLILYLINRRITYTTNILINKVEELIPEKLLKINKPTNKTVIITKNVSNLFAIL